MKAAYLGPAGTNGEEAAGRMLPGATLVPYPSHAAVAAAVARGEVDAGVVAIENSINGSVAETLDILIHEARGLEIQSEFVLPIAHHLVAAPGTRVEGVRVVFSHPQALGQCRRYLEQHLGKAQLEAALSTTEAVVQAVKRPGEAAAIGSARAAELYGAEILASHIEDSSANVTRFVTLGRGRPAPTGRDRTSIAFTFPEDRPGALAGVLNEFAKRGINCTRIESRPTRAVLGEYVFLVDFEGHQDEPLGREVLDAVRPLCAELLVFGSYPRGNTPKD
jgi:prephenate dehydratase